ncbi:hypothetical protein J7K74_02670 [Candidatus Woesearchaeota archaeon]|nr:hypothetical protein [Candidatus Woesearchaeota archaeon]
MFKRNKLIVILTGISYGIVGYSNTVSFEAATLFLSMSFIYEFINLYRRNKRSVNDYKNLFVRYILVGVIGAPIALLYWWWPLYSKFHAYNNITYYGHKDFARIDLMWKEFYSNFLGVFHLNSLDVFTFISFIGLMYIVYTLLKKEPKHREKRDFFLIVLSSMIIGVGHHFITFPLFRISSFPYMFAGAFSLVILIFLFYFFLLAIERLFKSKYIRTSLCVIVLALMFIGSITHFHEYLNNRFVKSAYNDISPYFKQLRDFINKNIDLNDVILTTKETCFAINGLTGRKCMVYRTTHTDPFSDPWKPQIDAAVILYGNNTNLKLELLKEYNVSYLYWDYYWMNSEWVLDANGKIINYFDPLMVPYKEEYVNKLRENNVEFQIGWYYFDPAVRGIDIPKIKGIIILPSNYYNFSHPWHPDLDPYLEEVWSYEYNDMKIARLFKINI